MAYILGLVVILAVIFSVTSGNNLVGNLLDQAKHGIANLFPKSEKQILIDNLNSSNGALDSLFSNTVPNLLNSKNVSEADKTAIKNAAASFTQSKSLLIKLENLDKKDKGILQSVVDKVLNLGNDTTSPEPTSIPPQCHLVCPAQ